MQLQLLEKINILGMELTLYGEDRECPLFLAREIATSIEHSDVSMMCKNLDFETEKLVQTILVSGQNRETIFLTEDGVYEVLMTSRKPKAKEFKRGLKDFLRAWRLKKVAVVEVPKPKDPLVIIQEALELANRMVAEERAKKEMLAIQLDMQREWHSIKRVAIRHGMSHKDFNWRLLKKASDDLGIEVKKIFDANYGEVNSYHVSAWEVAYPEVEL